MVGTLDGVAVVGAMVGTAVGVGETSVRATETPANFSPYEFAERSSRNVAPAGTAVAGTATCAAPRWATAMAGWLASGLTPSAEKYST